jgi:hypothetical protein
MGGMDERVRAGPTPGVKEDGPGLARPRGHLLASPDSPERLRYTGVVALCFLVVTLLSPLNLYLLFAAGVVLELRLAGRLGDKAVYPLAALAQTALFALLWLPLDAAARRWPAPARCLATVALTASYLGLWLAWNWLAFGP